MYGRLGGMYFLHLTEASAQRRRLAQSSHAESSHSVGTAGASRPAEGFGMFIRLIAVLGVAFAAIAALAIMIE
ncbi:hypothetical protein N7E02_01000 (plasmid) [Aliirhizobium terrae]|uniref:hypothetical protein n=1 Tax=Terrirhizobium terrae TaxID=2926709 RepID=UPI002577C4FD|nr:hypothetical protein [Rhizobium sp. CC-CFT758]WJH38026.1 hypothetical protein N7E02_01000 [Rhizobium sp. CC-CFT758]